MNTKYPRLIPRIEIEGLNLSEVDLSAPRVRDAKGRLMTAYLLANADWLATVPLDAVIVVNLVRTLYEPVEPHAWLPALRCAGVPDRAVEQWLNRDNRDPYPEFGADGHRVLVVSLYRVDLQVIPVVAELQCVRPAMFTLMETFAQELDEAVKAKRAS